MINFDLDTSALKMHFKDYTIAYTKLKTSFLKRGFEHRQGSGYVSIKPLANLIIINLIDEIVGENMWLERCMREFDITEVGETFSATKQIKEFSKNHRDRLIEQNSAQKTVQLHADESERD